MEWDVIREKGKLYYVDSVSEILSPSAELIGMEPREDKKYYYITALSAYADEKGSSEYRSNLDRSTNIPLDIDPTLIDVTDIPESNLSFKSVDHILNLLGVTNVQVPLSSFELSGAQFVPLDSLGLRVDLNKPSITRCAGQTWEYVGYYNYSTGLPQLQTKTVGSGQSKQLALFTRFIKLQTQRYGGRIYATGMDELGNLFQGYRVIDFKTGDSSTIDPGIELFTPDEIDNIENIVFPTYYPDLEVDNLVVNNTLSYGGETLELSNDVVINGENGLTLRIGGVDVITGDSSGEITSIFDNAGPRTIVAQSPPLTREDGSALQVGDLWFDEITSGTFMRITNTWGTQAWVQTNEYVPPERINGWPGFVNPPIPQNMLPVQSGLWDSGDTTLVSSGCLEISKTDSNYGQGPVSILNGERIWVRWKPGSAGTCGDGLHGTPIDGEIADDIYYVQGSLTLDRVPNEFNLGESDNYPLSTLVSSNVATLTGINASTKFWVQSTNAVGTISYKLNGGAWTNISVGEGNAVSIPLSIWPTIQFRITSSTNNATLTTLAIRVGESNTTGRYSEDTFEVTTIAAAVVDPIISTPSVVTPASLQQIQNSEADINLVSSTYTANAESGAHLSSDWEVWRGSTSASSFASDTTKTQIVNATNQTGAELASYALTSVVRNSVSSARFYARVRYRGSAAGALSNWSAYRVFDVINNTVITLSPTSPIVTGTTATIGYSIAGPVPAQFYVLLYNKQSPWDGFNSLSGAGIRFVVVNPTGSHGTVSFSDLQEGYCAAVARTTAEGGTLGAFSTFNVVYRPASFQILANALSNSATINFSLTDNFLQKVYGFSEQYSYYYSVGVVVPGSSSSALAGGGIQYPFPAVPGQSTVSFGFSVPSYLLTSGYKLVFSLFRGSGYTPEVFTCVFHSQNYNGLKITSYLLEMNDGGLSVTASGPTVGRDVTFFSKGSLSNFISKKVTGSNGSVTETINRYPAAGLLPFGDNEDPNQYIKLLAGDVPSYDGSFTSDPVTGDEVNLLLSLFPYRV